LSTSRLASLSFAPNPLTYIRYIRDYPESTSSEIWDFVLPHVRACQSTLNRYKRDGIYACRLAGAGVFLFMFCLQMGPFLSYKRLGSFYFLVLMACARIRPLLRQLQGPPCGGLARLIRWPTGMSFARLFCSKYLIFSLDSAYGTLIKSELIPAIAYLRTTYPLRVSLFFPAAFLETFCVNPDLDGTNLITTDTFFDAIYLYK